MNRCAVLHCNAFTVASVSCTMNEWMNEWTRWRHVRLQVALSPRLLLIIVMMMMMTEFSTLYFTTPSLPTRSGDCGSWWERRPVADHRISVFAVFYWSRFDRIQLATSSTQLVILFWQDLCVVCVLSHRTHRCGNWRCHSSTFFYLFYFFTTKKWWLF